jgi:hypothetical protein
MYRSMTACFAGVFGVSCSWNMNLSKKIRSVILSGFGKLPLSKCRTLIWTKLKTGAKPLPKTNGFPFCFVQPAWNRTNSPNGKNGSCLPGWFHWQRIIITFANLAPAAPANRIYTNKYHRTAFLYPAVKRQPLISFITWRIKLWGLWVYGTVSPLMKSPDWRM